MKRRADHFVSHIISSVGHPVLLVSVFVVLVNFKEFALEKAKSLTFLALGFFVVPVCLYILYKMWRGDYKNFDVSTRQNRNSLYPLIIFLQAALLVYLYVRDYSWVIFSGLLSGLILTVLGFIINQFLKVSMHTTVSFFIAILLIHVENDYSFSMLFFAVLIAYSRVNLGRHTFPEIAVGTALGLFSGLCFHLLINYL